MNPIVSRVLERHRNKLLMSAALLCGGVAVYAGSQYVNEQVQAERARLQVPDQQTVEVVVASAALVPGDTISAANMAVRSVPVDYVPSGAVTPDQFEALDGQRLMQPMHPGEILSAHALESADRQMFSSRVRPGIRAMTISVDEINSISGMLQPGDRVDLLLTARPPSADGRGEAAHDATVPLLQNLLVMATGRQVRPGDAGEGEGRSFSAVTVEVTPEQAQRLIVAQRAGRLTAVLRNPGDGEPMNTAAIDVRSLFPQPARAPVVPRRAVVRRDERPQMIVGGMGQADAIVQPGRSCSRPACAGNRGLTMGPCLWGCRKHGGWQCWHRTCGGGRASGGFHAFFGRRARCRGRICRGFHALRGPQAGSWSHACGGGRRIPGGGHTGAGLRV